MIGSSIIFAELLRRCIAMSILCSFFLAFDAFRKLKPKRPFFSHLLSTENP
ncbi:hypothetical protein Bca101_066939 [Brassica carinata]